MRKRGAEPVVVDFPLPEVHLVDTSAWSKSRNDARYLQVFDESARRGLVATCDVVCLELPILHYDHDYDLIASITGQPSRWLAQPGTLP